MESARGARGEARDGVRRQTGGERGEVERHGGKIAGAAILRDTDHRDVAAMSITTITITSLADLIARVTPAEPDPATGRHRDSGVFRGAANAEWPLLTSLDTLGGVTPPTPRRISKSTSSAISSGIRARSSAPAR